MYLQSELMCMIKKKRNKLWALLLNAGVLSLLAKRCFVLQVGVSHTNSMRVHAQLWLALTKMEASTLVFPEDCILASNAFCRFFASRFRRSFSLSSCSCFSSLSRSSDESGLDTCCSRHSSSSFLFWVCTERDIFPNDQNRIIVPLQGHNF